MAGTCPGPLVWRGSWDAEGNRDGGGAVLECGTCDYFIATGWFNDAEHADTPVLREGLSA